MDSLQLLNRISPERQEFVFGCKNALGKLSPRDAAQIHTQRHCVKKSSQDSLAVSLLRSPINKESCNHFRLRAEQTQHFQVSGQENALQRDLERLGQPLQTIRHFRRDLNLKPHDLPSVGVRLGERPASDVSGSGARKGGGPIIPAFLGLKRLAFK